MAVRQLKTTTAVPTTVKEIRITLRWLYIPMQLKTRIPKKGNLPLKVATVVAIFRLKLLP